LKRTTTGVPGLDLVLEDGLERRLGWSALRTQGPLQPVRPVASSSAGPYGKGTQGGLETTAFSRTLLSRHSSGAGAGPLVRIVSC
jgi:hypothetical protein